MKNNNLRTTLKKVAGISLSFVMAVNVIAMNVFTMPVQAKSNACSVYEGGNQNEQDYNTWSSPIYSYLHDCGDGLLMRVQYINNVIVAEYYDTEYNLLSSQEIEMELDRFGGFYAMGDYYYILSGQSNSDCLDDMEVYRITKYDKEWKKAGYCCLRGANTTIPFDAGSARMTNVGDYLLIHTSHEMYSGHQANLTMEVDTSFMEITDAFFAVANNSYGYVSHSFNQFIQVENNKIVTVDHGDAHPRSIVLIKNPKDCSEGNFSLSLWSDEECVSTDLFPFEGEIGKNYTGASVGGFEISDDAYLVAGNYDISSSNAGDGRNIFIAKEDKATGEVAVNYVTDYKAGEQDASTPQFVSIGKNRYLLLWTTYKNKKYQLHYTVIDGNGNKVSDIYNIEGKLSDCVPIVTGNKLVWYVWNDSEITFYEINTQNLADISVKTKWIGHEYVYGKEVMDKTVTMTCEKCGITGRATVPTSFSVKWKGATDATYWYYTDRTTTYKYLIGDTVLCHAIANDGDVREMEVISSSPDVIAISQRDSDEDFVLNMTGVGIAEITVRPKYNPAVTWTYRFQVGEDASVDVNETDVTIKEEQSTYTGKKIEPEIKVCYKGVVLSPQKDYTVAYQDNKNAGTAKVTVSGEGLFKGTKVLEFEILPIDLKDCMVIMSDEEEDYIYTGASKTPGIKVQHDSSAISKEYYTVAYKNNVNVGTASAVVEGKGNYIGTVEKEFAIQPLDLSNCEISLEYKTTSYTGEKCTPLVTVKKEEVIPQENYTVSYFDNTDVGTAKVTITGTNNCTGEMKETFSIYKKVAPVTITSLTNVQKGVLLKWDDPKEEVSGFYIYRCDKNGKYKKIKKITSNTTISYLDTDANTNGMKYQYRVIPYAEIESGEYKAETTKSGLVYRLKTPAVSSLKNTSSKTLLVNWKKNANVTGYQIQYATNSKFSGAKTIKVKRSSVISKKISGLKKGKKYYVRIRTYKTVSGVNYYSQWSQKKQKSMKKGKYK